MGLFGKKQEATTKTNAPKREYWISECGPLCGFRVQDHDKMETVQIIILHNKVSHKTNVTQAEVLADMKSVML